ncbi:hypothetical protein [Candidatus Igneacidithiobacillus taiwanensis]|uniref:hypothetical protein n=1 Tax=Candidatus Igneacidithiobacillus taiwanensis TaxID=1945924 RepID=UPI00289F52F2|nr:hypothetical protein [Candidatus Igneacidithiobacillus taiwanensis]
MSGLSSYPRSYGHSLPGHVAAALQHHVPEEDRNTYATLYEKEPPPDYLDVNHGNPHRQPGAVKVTNFHHLIHPRLNNVESMLTADPFIPDVFKPLLEPLRAWLRQDAANENPVFKAFSEGVTLRVLPAGTVLYRIIGVVIPLSSEDVQWLREGHFRVSNDPLGDWWVDEVTLKGFRSEAEMRSSLALRTEWNGDHGVVQIVLPKEVAVAYGPASWQHSANPHMVFPGGGKQIFMPLRDGPCSDLIDDLARNLQLSPMPWVNK